MTDYKTTADIQKAYNDLAFNKGLELEDLSKTQLNRIYSYAKKEQDDGLSWALGQSAIDKKNRSIDYWLSCHLNYKQATSVMQKIDNFRMKESIKEGLSIVDKPNTGAAKNEAELPEKLEDLLNHKNSNETAKKQLKEIWLPEAIISIEDFIQKGIDGGVWNEDLIIQTKRNSLYSNGKKLLSAMYKAIEGNAIRSNTDHKKVGKILCEVFNIEIKPEVKDPYKTFSSPDSKIAERFKTLFRF
jgi:hypothetical protein